MVTLGSFPLFINSLAVIETVITSPTFAKDEFALSDTIETMSSVGTSLSKETPLPSMSSIKAITCVPVFPAKSVKSTVNEIAAVDASLLVIV